MHGKDGKVFNAFFAAALDSGGNGRRGCFKADAHHNNFFLRIGLSASSMHSSADETTRTSAPAARFFWRLSPFVPGTLSISPKVANIIFF